MKTKDSTTSSKTKGNGKGSGGRPSKYETCVKPYIENIKSWKKSGASNEQICEVLEIGTSAFYDYKNKYSEFAEAFEISNKFTDLELSSALYKAATGFEYQEKKQYIKDDPESGKRTTYTEITTKYQAPNPTAIAMYKRNINPEWIDKDRVTTDLKVQEKELQKMIAEQKYWTDLNSTDKNDE